MSSRSNAQIFPLRHAISYILLIVIGVAMLFPFIWMVLTSLRQSSADVLNFREMIPSKSAVLTESDVIDTKRFAMLLADKHSFGRPAIAEEIAQFCSPTLRNQIRDVADGQPYDDDFKTALVASLNDFLGQRDSAAIDPPDQVRLANRERFDAAFVGLIDPARTIHWENYRTVILQTGFGQAFLNSLFITSTVTIGLVFTSSLAAYAFARLTFFGRDQIFLGYLATMMIPGVVTIIPAFILLRELNWMNSYWALIIPPIFSAYGVFLLRQFFLSLPRELEEAAILDGCSAFGVYWRIILPLSTPALTALAILTFMGSWRSFMWPLIVTHTPDMFTLPLALSQFQELYGVRWTLLMAGSVLMILPMLIVFLMGQRFFIEGIQVGAVKG